MKISNGLRYIAGAGLITSIMLITPVATAHTNSTNSDNASTDSSNSSSDTSTGTGTDQQSRQERIDKFKAEFKIVLSLGEKEHIKTRCVVTQSLVGKLNVRFDGNVTKRTEAYTAIQNALNKIDTILKAKSVDTTTLETEIASLNTKIATFNTDLTAYKQTLTDLNAVDCKTDQTGFQAALLAARTAHTALMNDASAIRVYITTIIRPTLETIRTQLQASESSNNSTSGGTN